MRLKVFFLALTSTLTVSANDDTDSTIVFKQDLSNVTIVGHNEIRMLREAAMPVSVLGARQLDGTATSINDVLARTTGKVETKVATVDGFPSFFYSFE